ncbi:MAG: GNAT family N-acetyltransferase [Bacteroidetes bacterium]|nr:GNAT family N-acetyltransferase [Bacteroidota bacterium]
MQHAIVKYYAHADITEVKAFYEKTTYRNSNSIAYSDQIVLAEIGAEKVGILRICTEQGSTVLRGFNILPEYQRLGIGTLMLRRAVIELENLDCYLICKRQLNPFYEPFGFRQCRSGVPDFLLERRSQYANPELNILKSRLGKIH